MVSCINAVSKTAKHLHRQHGEVSALKLVASELRKARRARSRERFIFSEVGRGATCRTGPDDPIRPTRKTRRFAPVARGLRARLPWSCHSFDVALIVG